MVVNYISEQFKSSTLFKSEALNTKDKYEVFTGGNHPLILNLLVILVKSFFLLKIHMPTAFYHF